MASSKEDVASQALARLGEPAISAFDEDSDTAEKVNQLYEDTILELLASYEWNWAKERATLSIDGAYSSTKWTYGFSLPALKTVRVGNPLKVYNSTALNPPAFFDWELAETHIETNADTIVIEYIKRKDESLWPGWFVRFAVEALASILAIPVTENESKEEWHTRKAFGLPSENGLGGLFARAMMADIKGTPTRGLLDDSDPIGLARFGGGMRDGRW